LPRVRRDSPSLRSFGKRVRDLTWVPEGFRWCPTCEQAVPHEEYIRNSASPSGFGGRCKACHNRLSKEAYWQRRYGLTKAAVDEMRRRQGDACALCGESGPQHLDHDHATGRTRQRLCQRCNHGLGLFRDDPRLLKAGAEYVRFHTISQHAVALFAAAGISVRPIRPGEPPVGSERRPGGRSTSTRTTGRTSGSRRRKTAGEADG
jgi:hypothetical protein